MIEKKFTPGPWSFIVRPHSVSIIVGPDKPSSDEIKWRLHGGEGECDDNVRIANARLIAAAPDLLLVAKMALKPRVDEYDSYDEWHQQLAAMAEAVIAKAEGTE